VSDELLTTDEYVAETLARLPARVADDGFVGDTPDWYGPTLFGGFVLGQATTAITQAAPDGFEINSFHAYFLSAIRSGPPVDYEIAALRDGRSFAHRSLAGAQEGRPVFSMIASFTRAGSASDFEYGRPFDPATPRPADLDIFEGDDPWDSAEVGPTEPAADGFLASSSRRWFRFARALPDDPHLHASLLAYATDMTGRGARPLMMDTDSIEGIVSLDHAVAFHRPARVDEWLFFDITSTVNTGGRGYLRGQIHHEDGTHVASVTQETLLWDPASRP